MVQQFTVHKSQRTAVLILGHGSPVAQANDTLREVAKAVKARGNYDVVQPAFLQFERPSFSEAVNILVAEGAQRIIVHPYFLYMGAHVTKDLPFEIDTIKKRYPDLDIVLAPHLGYHEKLVEVAVEKIEDARCKMQDASNLKLDACKLQLNQHPIEAESFRIIGEELDASRFSPTEAPVVKRIIHTTADFEYAELVRFGNHAIEAGLDAVSRGADIITDVRMVEVGINKERVDRLGGRVRCFVADDEVIRLAREKGVTKTAAAMHKASGFINGSIVVVGNAPTALIELVGIINKGGAMPSLIIGVPVGFVGAEESKEALMRLSVPYISVKGRKGGSTVAVAIVNALLMMAEERLQAEGYKPCVKI